MENGQLLGPMISNRWCNVTDFTSNLSDLNMFSEAFAMLKPPTKAWKILWIHESKGILVHEHNFYAIKPFKCISVNNILTIFNNLRLIVVTRKQERSLNSLTFT